MFVRNNTNCPNCGNCKTFDLTIEDVPFADGNDYRLGINCLSCDLTFRVEVFSSTVSTLVLGAVMALSGGASKDLLAEYVIQFRDERNAIRIVEHFRDRLFYPNRYSEIALQNPVFVGVVDFYLKTDSRRRGRKDHHLLRSVGL